MNMKAFTDEITKIAGLPGTLMELGKQHAGKLLIPASAVGGVLGWEELKKRKRYHDIGKAYSEQMEARGG